jgi:predicted DNA-binding protein
MDDEEKFEDEVDRATEVIEAYLDECDDLDDVDARVLAENIVRHLRRGNQ